MKEQDLLTIRHTLGRLYWNIYQSCLDSGFTTAQSFSLLQTWMLSQNPNGIRPDREVGPETDNPE